VPADRWRRAAGAGAGPGLADVAEFRRTPYLVTMLTPPPSRRGFLALCAVALMGLRSPPPPRHWMTMCGVRRGGPHPHPTPRPGITAEKVLASEDLGVWADAAPAFDEVRQIPEIIDGIRCNCGCADDPSFYSLLTCYEGSEAMARVCHICQGQGRLAFRLHQAGKTLDEIRAGIDARYG
jgi:hypothetical protein